MESKDQHTDIDTKVVERNAVVLRLLVELLHNSNWTESRVNEVMSEYVDPIRIMLSKSEDAKTSRQIIEWRRDYLNTVWNDVWQYQKDDTVIDRAKKFLTDNPNLT